MTDNVTLPGNGLDVATDEIGGKHYQRVKLIQGADGTNDGDVSSTSPLQVTLANTGANATAVKVDGSAVTQPVSAASLPLPSGASTSANQTTIIGHLDGVEGLLTAIDADTGTLAVTGGGVEASALRVTIASDSTGVVSVDDNGSTLSIDDGGGTITVDGTVAISGTVTVDSELPSAAALADNTANPTTTSVGTFPHWFDGTTWDRALGNATDGLLVNLGTNNDVTVTGTVTANAGTNLNTSALALETGGNLAAAATSLALIDNAVSGSGFNITQLAGAAVPIGAGLEATALRVTLATDSTGLVSVDDNGGSLTVDNAGTFAVQAAQSGTWNITNISGTVSLPTGAATAAKQPALGTAGTASADVITVQGIASMTPLAVSDNSGSLTVDAPVGTPVFVRLSDGATAISTLPVSLASVPSHAVTNAGTFAVQVDAALPAGTNAIGKLAANSGVDIGDVDVTSISAGTNLIGDVGLSGARTSGGTTLYKNIDVDETEDQVKATAGQIYWINAINLASSVRYLKIYNATAANVTVGTTVPDLTFPLPTAGSANGAGFTLAIPNGIAFSTAITIAATTGVADNDSGAPGANEVIVNLGYA
jgi:hypothetical protein